MNIYYIIITKNERIMVKSVKKLFLPVMTLMLCLFFATSGGFAQKLPVLRKDEAPSYARPADNLLIIVADLQRHLGDDVYRQPYAVDITGQNVFRACLIRLANYESMYGERESDVVAMSRAQAYEKLCDFANAKANYEKAAGSKDAALSKKAAAGKDRVDKFLKILAVPLDTSGARPYERDLEVRIRDTETLANELEGTDYACLALIEKERAMEQMADLIMRMRAIAPYSPDQALDALKKLNDENPKSKKRYTHHLGLGDYYLDQAKQYVILHDPNSPGFKENDFRQYIAPARAEYTIVSQADGYAQKPEGVAKLAALNAFYERVMAEAK